MTVRAAARRGARGHLRRTVAATAATAGIALSAAAIAPAVRPMHPIADVRVAAPSRTAGTVIFSVVPAPPSTGPSQTTPSQTTPSPPHGQLPRTGNFPTPRALLILGALLLVTGAVVTITRRGLDHRPSRLPPRRD
jgi:hypothetical protein